MPAISTATPATPCQVRAAIAAQASTAGVSRIQKPGLTGSPLIAPAAKTAPQAVAPRAGAALCREIVAAARAVRISEVVVCMAAGTSAVAG
jgi:hypothetical protein